MLAPLDPPANGSATPGSSREVLTSNGAPQGPVTAASPQYIDGTIITSHIGAESPYWTPTTSSRSPYIRVFPYMYQQDPYQQSYLHRQQAYPEPGVRVYPDPVLVDTPIATMKPTKPALASAKKSKSTGRRKKIIWAMAIITIILLAVVIYLVVSMKKNKDSSSGGSSTSGGSPTSGGRVQAPPIPPYPSEKGHCPTFFCHSYYFDTCEGECKKDSVYQTCKDGCKGEFFCINDCEKGETCFDDCTTNLGRCNSYCFR
ncbi:hypothetical protein BGX30_011139 [Mortierella sp. GBA39]|nr:hypothetical protein BGX30_011139 [Mortierella sp. GBA39]